MRTLAIKDIIVIRTRSTYFCKERNLKRIKWLTLLKEREGRKIGELFWVSYIL